jgi:SAM-dependent methyltransferase
MKYDPASRQYVFQVDGYCPICEAASSFSATSEKELDNLSMRHLFRNRLLCSGCGSVPRERALFSVIQDYYPNWRELDIHESSPVRRGLSAKMLQECSSYLPTQYDPVLGFGNIHPQQGYRSEDLEKQTFPDETFDLVITQDVFEHLFDPGAAIREIGRTLRPGGGHIFTVPLVKGTARSVRRARLIDGTVEHLLPPYYHGNPMSKDGSLVTIDWGYDIVPYLAACSGLSMALLYIDDLTRGIRASFNEVLMATKLRTMPEI